MTASSYQQQGLSAHLMLLTLAMPMILANITTPLLGLVDTAVMGHMEGSAQLAGASIGTLILTQIYWVCGFLRMSATGLSAQAKGANNAFDIARVLYQTLAIALCLGLAIVLLQTPLLSSGLWLASPSESVEQFSRAYFDVRVWGAPGALMNIALIGWLIGQQKTTAVLVIQVVGNLLNAGLDITFVWWLGFGVEGVALASVIAEYTMAALAMWVSLRHVQWHKPVKAWFNKAARLVLLKLNSDIFLRNLILQICLGFLTLQGARYGETATAINAILMQFFVLIALGLDGIAYAVEAKVGEAVGAKDPDTVIAHTHRGLWWSSVFACAYAVVFYAWGPAIIALLTNIEILRREASSYLPLMAILPLVAHWCFLFDGVFVGLTHAKAMRNTMLISAIVVYFPVWFIVQELGNIALWWALLGFLLARGLSLAAVFYWEKYQGRLIVDPAPK